MDTRFGIQPERPGYFNANYPIINQNVNRQPQFANPMQPPMPVVQYVPDEMTAKRGQFPMDGTPVIYINENAQEIYMRYLNLNDGTVPFKKFAIVEDKQPVFATADDIGALRNEIQKLRDELGGMRSESNIDSVNDSDAKRRKHAANSTNVHTEESSGNACSANDPR